MPGHLDRQDYSLYYMDIDEAIRTPIKAPEIDQELERIHDPEYFPKSVNSQVVFLNMIYDLINKEKAPSITKLQVMTSINFEEGIIKELGFSDKSQFIRLIKVFQTDLEGYFTREEFIRFMLSNLLIEDRDKTMNLRSEREEGNLNRKEKRLATYAKSTANARYETDADDKGQSKTQLKFTKNINPVNFDETTEEAIREEKLELNRSASVPGKKKKRAGFSSGEYGITGIKSMHSPEDDSKNAKKRPLSHSRDFDESPERNNDDIYNDDLETSFKKKIGDGTVTSKGLKVTFNDYTDFTIGYRTRGDVKITIPKPFSFNDRGDEERKNNKINEILADRAKKEKLAFKKFKANRVNKKSYKTSLKNIVKQEAEKRKQRTEKLKEKIEQEMKPFSFYENDQKRFKQKQNKQPNPPKFEQFKAKEIPWTSQVNLFENMIKEGENARKQRVEERARQLTTEAKLPPRMEMHEHKRKELERNNTASENQAKKNVNTFRHKPIPDFKKMHEVENKQLEKKKSSAQATQPIPFNFTESKVHN